MKYNPDKHHRRSIRLQGYDYSRIGKYFITIRTHNRKCLFGDIMSGVMILNEAGRMVEKCWNDIPIHFPHVELDEWVIMPDHVHGILSITMNGDYIVVGAKNFSPLLLHQHEHQHAHDDNDNDAHNHQPCGTSKTIGSIVRGFKIGVTKWIRQNTTDYDVWQRNYWEHIIRNENELDKIRIYIRNNPKKWQNGKLKGVRNNIVIDEIVQYVNEE